MSTFGNVQFLFQTNKSDICNKILHPWLFSSPSPAIYCIRGGDAIGGEDVHEYISIKNRFYVSRFPPTWTPPRRWTAFGQKRSHVAAVLLNGRICCLAALKTFVAFRASLNCAGWKQPELKCRLLPVRLSNGAMWPLQHDDNPVADQGTFPESWSCVLRRGQHSHQRRRHRRTGQVLWCRRCCHWNVCRNVWEKRPEKSSLMPSTSSDCCSCLI